MKILFQGDSVTDAGRSRKDSYFGYYGCGYPNMVASRLLMEEPGKYEFINLGVSGNRVLNLYSRWRKDCVQLKPDLISILIGVNDVWHEFAEGNGVPLPRFEKVLRMLIDETAEELPGVKFLLMEPFVTHGGAVDSNYDTFLSEARARAEVMAAVAKDHGIPMIPLQRIFDEALSLAPADYWTLDGVHPTAAGHALIAKNWIETFRAHFA